MPMTRRPLSSPTEQRKEMRILISPTFPDMSRTGSVVDSPTGNTIPPSKIVGFEDAEIARPTLRKTSVRSRESTSSERRPPSLGAGSKKENQLPR